MTAARAPSRALRGSSSARWYGPQRSWIRYARGHGSPTILIDERDVAADHPQASSCRLYDQGDGTLAPPPPVAVILTAPRKRSP